MAMVDGSRSASPQIGTGHDASTQASGSSMRLPSQKTYLTSLSILAFLSGIGIATVVTVRRGKRMVAEDAIEGARRAKMGIAPTKQATSAPTAASRAAEGARDTPMGKASSKGIMSLFVEMNRAAFSKKGRSQLQDKKDAIASASTPSALRRGKTLKVAKSTSDSLGSVFDAQASAPPPSILMRPTEATKKAASKKIRTTTKPADQTAGDTADPEGATSSIGEAPAVMALKAFGIATAVVGTATWLSVEIGCRLLNVRSVDELAEKLTNMVPSSTRGKRALDGVGNAARQVLGGEAPVDDEELQAVLAQANHEAAPLSTEDALDALDAAIERGDAGAWADTLGRQLDAERARDLLERRRRIAEAKVRPSLYATA